MLTATKVFASDLTTELLERLYNEAYPYISEERQRMGTEALKAALIEDLKDYPIMQYKVDNYLVGIASYTDIVYNNTRYMFHRHPLYGQTESGSRAWWYSEDFQRVNSEYVTAEGYAGVITLFNPSSPAGIAVSNHFGSFNKYYKTPVIIDDPEILGLKLKIDAKDKLKAFVIDLID